MQICSKTNNDVGAKTWTVKKAQAKKLDVAERKSWMWRSEKVGCGGNEHVEMDVWNHKVGQNINKRNRGTPKVGEISKTMQESRSKWYKKNMWVKEG